MNRQQLYDVWAPLSSPWSAWVKPVLFAQSDEFSAPTDYDWPALSVPQFDTTSALVIDLPGPAAIHFAREVVAQGFRPLPLYNAIAGPMTASQIVPVNAIVSALRASADWLATVSLVSSAPPAFLLDAHRNPPTAQLQPGVFDNRSISLPTDFPSAATLKSFGLRGVTLVTSADEPPAADLAHTLRRWQDAGLPITQLALSTAARRPIEIKKPWQYRTLWHNLIAAFGLKKSPLGGFGGMLPIPTSGGMVG